MIGLRANGDGADDTAYGGKTWAYYRVIPGAESDVGHSYLARLPQSGYVLAKVFGCPELDLKQAYCR